MAHVKLLNPAPNPLFPIRPTGTPMGFTENCSQTERGDCPVDESPGKHYPGKGGLEMGGWVEPDVGSLNHDAPGRITGNMGLPGTVSAPAAPSLSKTGGNEGAAIRTGAKSLRRNVITEPPPPPPRTGSFMKS